MTRKEVQQGYIPFSSKALWHNEIQKYHPEMKCWDSEPIARKAACGDFSALPEDMLLIVQELSEPETTAHVEPKTAVVDIQPKSQTTQPSEPKSSTPVQEVKPKRNLPTPKNPRGFVCNFNECKDPEKLRKMLNAGNIDVVKSIAESFNEFQPRTDGKPITKKDYVTAIVKLYFPDYQPAKKAPVQETQQVNYPFVPGKIYIKAKYRTTREIELVKVIRRKGDYITVQEISYPELVPMFKTQRVKVQHDRFLTQEGFMLDSHDTTDLTDIPKDCVYSHSDYIYNPDYYQPKTSQPEHKPETSAPVQEVKQETTEQPAITAPQPAPSEPEHQQEIITRCQHKAKAEPRKNTPKPATRKPRHAKTTDTSRQILIPFDDEERPDPTSEPAKLKAKRSPRMPRVKTDYSRQILIDFGENIPSSQTNQRQAA